MEKQGARILELFEEINAIPRCSRNEARLGDWLAGWAMSLGLENRKDDAGNLVVRVPPTQGMANRPTVIVQGHMDMVCEKTPESTHDFSSDPIRSRRDGEWLSAADRTTLGADNGIALAYAMALAENGTIRRPPLELLFTVDEETGLNGVKQMSPDLIHGKILINLDSEDEGVFTIGCAGGMNTLLTLPMTREPLPPGWVMFRIAVGGLRGGHSGIDINKQRGNANKVLARLLSRLPGTLPWRLIDLSGGTRHNAISRDASAVIACAQTHSEHLGRYLNEMAQTIRVEYAGVDDNLSVGLENTVGAGVKNALNAEDSRRAVDLLLSLPHGVSAMSTLIDGLVETSSNLATIAMVDDTLEVLCSQRSANMSRLTAITDAINAIGALAGARMNDHNRYPPWQPDPDAPLLHTAKRVYSDLFGTEPSLQVIHAGLECAIIGERCPGMQMISFGPNIENPHSPTERLHVPSVDRVWRFLVSLLESIEG